MVLPLLASSFLGAAASTAGSNLINRGIGAIFGDSAPSPQEQMQDFLDAQLDAYRKAADIATKAAEESEAESEAEIKKIEEKFYNSDTKKEWKARFPSAYKSLANNVFEYNVDPNAATQKMLAGAYGAGLNDTSMVKVPGQEGKMTLKSATNDLISSYESNAPNLWTENLSKLFMNELGRLPTKQEMQRYNYRDYKSNTAVRDDLARNNNDYYERNIMDIDPAFAALRSYTGGFASRPTAYTEYTNNNRSQGYSDFGTNKTKKSSSGIDFNNPRPRMSSSTNKSNEDYASFS